VLQRIEEEEKKENGFFEKTTYKQENGNAISIS
jgi:hypothetical protein